MRYSSLHNCEHLIVKKLSKPEQKMWSFIFCWFCQAENDEINLILLSFVEIKVSLTGLSKFKEGVSKIYVYRGKEKAIGVFISGSDNKQFGWIPRETISEVQRMGRMEDLKISLITF